MKTKRVICLYGAVLCLLLSTLPTWAFYNPTTGRWLNRDPLEEQGGNNLYVSVENNPVNGLDPFGMAPGDVYGNIPKWFRKLIHGLVSEGEVLKGPNGQVPPRELKVAFDRAMREYGGNQGAIQKAYGNKGGRMSRGIRGTRGGSGAALVMAIGLTMVETMAHATVAIQNYLSGVHADDDTPTATIESMFRNLAQGSGGMADLDAVLAALEITGGSAADALVAWATLQAIGEGFTSQED